MADTAKRRKLLHNVSIEIEAWISVALDYFDTKNEAPTEGRNTNEICFSVLNI